MAPDSRRIRFRRAPAQDAHVELHEVGKSKPGVGLCGHVFTDERVLAPYPAGSEKGIRFWQEAVCTACIAVMDGMEDE